ncbi:MAG: hypothetical protein KAG66_03790 [Methylococcales bacterium]|nr:hypothetical protein [Methylococcales bacterium]
MQEQLSVSFEQASLDAMSAVGMKNLLTLQSKWLLLPHMTSSRLTDDLLFFFCGVLGSVHGILCLTGVCGNIITASAGALAINRMGLFRSPTTPSSSITLFFFLDISPPKSSLGGGALLLCCAATADPSPKMEGDPFFVGVLGPARILTGILGTIGD